LEAVIVSVADPTIPWKVAVIVVLPCPTPVVRPELFTVATPVFVEAHAAVLVKFCVLPSP